MLWWIGLHCLGLALHGVVLSRDVLYSCCRVLNGLALSRMVSCCIDVCALYCIVLNAIEPYCIVRRCVVMSCVVLCCIVSYCVKLSNVRRTVSNSIGCFLCLLCVHCAVLCRVVSIVLYCLELYCVVWCWIVLYCFALRIALHGVVLCRVVLFSAVLC